MMIRIDAPHFCAGAIINNGVIKGAAPILKWMENKTVEKVIKYCNQKKWHWQILRWAIRKGAP
jgi:hypothetical protein